MNDKGRGIQKRTEPQRKEKEGMRSQIMTQRISHDGIILRFGKTHRGSSILWLESTIKSSQKNPLLATEKRLHYSRIWSEVGRSLVLEPWGDKPKEDMRDMDSHRVQNHPGGPLNSIHQCPPQHGHMNPREPHELFFMAIQSRRPLMSVKVLGRGFS